MRRRHPAGSSPMMVIVDAEVASAMLSFVTQASQTAPSRRRSPSSAADRANNVFTTANRLPRSSSRLQT